MKTLTDAEKVELVNKLTTAAIRYEQAPFGRNKSAHRKLCATEIQVLKQLLQREPTAEEINQLGN